jgi:hypothetical protein
MPSEPSSSNSGLFRPLLNVVSAVFNTILTIIRRVPMVAVFVVVAVVLYYQQAEQPAEQQESKFRDPEERQESRPPTDLPAGTNPSLWTCVHRVDSQLSNGLWADVYYGMEVRLDGKVVTIKVTEKWKDLSDDKRKTVTDLVVNTWIETGRALHLLKSGEDLEEIVLKSLPDDQTVAAWRPTTGVQLFAPQAGA